MTEAIGISLLLGEAGHVASLSDGSKLQIVRENADDWASLRRLVRNASSVRGRVPAEATFDLALPDMPVSGRELRMMLRDGAPLVRAQIAWTRPYTSEGQGKPTVTIARRAWLEERVAEAEGRLGVDVRPVADSNGAPFLYRSPRQRRRQWTTLAVFAGSLFVVVANAQIAGPTAVLPPDQHGGVSTHRKFAASVAGHAGVAALMTRFATAAPPGSSLAAMNQDRGGTVSMTFDTPDPDAFRFALAQQGRLRGFREGEQLRLPDAAFRVTWTTTKPVTPSVVRHAPPVAAASRSAAFAAVTRELHARATVDALQLQLVQGSGSAASPLFFGLDLIGPQASVLGFANRLESGLPPARLVEWRLVPDLAGVRLSGTLMVPWTSGG